MMMLLSLQRTHLLFLLGFVFQTASSNVAGTREIVISSSFDQLDWKDGTGDKAFQVECPLPYFDIGGSCLMISTESEGTWVEMKLLCQQIGGQLVKIDTDNLHYYIAKYIRDNGLPDHDYWIGGSDTAEEGKFVWTDGTNMKMGTPFWGFYFDDKEEQPNGGTSQNCALLYAPDRYRFHDGVCDKSNRVICQYV